MTTQFPLRSIALIFAPTKSPLHPAPFALLFQGLQLCMLAVAIGGAMLCTAQSKPAAPPPPDVLVLSNGDTLHGKFVSEVAGKVTFHSDPLGDVSLTWDKIKELHTSQQFALLDKNVKLHGKKSAGQIPVGTFDVVNQSVVIHPQSASTVAPVPVKDTQYIIDEATLNKQINHEPNLMTGWNGAATAGATIVAATQNQDTFSGAVNLVRVVPTVSWLNPRDRTLIGFSGSYGKITQPGYFATPGNPTSFVAATVTKSAIYHAGAERDEYFSPRFYVLAQTAFDHNFSQDLDLQQIYGGGIGWTAVKTPKQELDLNGTVQYEKQQFITGASGTNQNLIGSTFSTNYRLHLKLVTYTQGLSFIPAYNDPHAYSANETNSFVFPAYKNLGFSLGTIDSYLNDPPLSAPPTRRNSFQFTMGLTYAIKSKY
jgi:hypothetical protein